MPVRRAEAAAQRTDEGHLGSGGGAGALARVAARVRPVSLARDEPLPVMPALQDLLPDAGLARGTTVAVTGTSLALALAAGPSQTGSWVVVVGVPWLGLAALARSGLDLARVAVVAEPDPAVWATVVAALVGAFDVVVLAEPVGVRSADARRLSARIRERGTVLVLVEPSDIAVAAAVGAASGGRGGHHRLEIDVRLAVTTVAWEGLGEGHGYLRSRRVRVEATGRRRAARPRTVELWLPGPAGVEPAGAEPVGVDPVGAEPAGVEPVGVELVGVEPVVTGRRVHPGHWIQTGSRFGSPGSDAQVDEVVGVRRAG